MHLGSGGRDPLDTWKHWHKSYDELGSEARI